MVLELGIGGSERQTAATALALDRRIFEPHVVAFRARGFRADELRAAGIPVLEVPVTSLRGPSAVKGAAVMAQFLRRRRIQLVHTFDTPLNLFGTVVARCSRVPVVLSSQRAYRGLAKSWERMFLRLTDRIVDGVVVNCRAVERHMADDERTPSPLHLCYNGIDTGIFCPGPPRPGLGPGLAIGVVCSLRPEKDLATLLRGFSLVRRVQHDARLFVVGSGPELEGLRRLAAHLEIAGACHFEPSTPDVAPWLRSFDIFVLPSRSEAFSNSLMEAMACGCCPVTSDVGGNPELVRTMETGLLFRCGDPADLAARILALAEDAALRRTLASQASARIMRDFSLEAAGRRMGEIYLSFLQSSGFQI